MRRSTMLILALSLTAAGCTSAAKLETGYVIRPLGASYAEMRGSYASKYTVESRAAQIEREQEIEARRPRPGN